ncbi:hypothetical protein [Tsukamurella tyrosinosolvens]|uniref:DUF7257 domain-containing protein n=1 Tax=Tsukamurella tyrosinosolvens TaxID=57704 RepID=UPI003462BF81
MTYPNPSDSISQPDGTPVLPGDIFAITSGNGTGASTLPTRTRPVIDEILKDRVKTNNPWVDFATGFLGELFSGFGTLFEVADSIVSVLTGGIIGGPISGQSWVATLSDWVGNFTGGLGELQDFVKSIIDTIMNALGFFGSGFGLGALLDAIFNNKASTDATKTDLASLASGLLSAPATVLGSIPQTLIPIATDIINGITGFLNGAGAPGSGGSLSGMLSALGSFTGSTNSTATTADSAQGVGSNALTNTVSIQAQVSGLADRVDTGQSARALWTAMDYTADATFGKHLMNNPAHVHSASFSGSLGGVTGFTIAGGDNHRHPLSVDASVSGSVSVSNPTYTITPAVVNSSTAFLGYIRCGSVQEKRLFTFLAQSSGTVSTFNLDVYRMASDGGLTLAYSSASFAGAITGVLGWVQHAIPSGTASVAVQPGDIIAVQLRMTGSGSVSLGGITTPLPLNPAGWYPLRESAVRNPSTPAPSTIAAGTANASHTSTAIPYIEAGIDTGLANAPLSLADNFNGSLSQYWLMTGSNSLEIASNNLGIYQTGTSGSTGVSWGKFQKQVNTDQSKVGFTTTSPNGQRQIVWFHGSGPNDHVGLEITSSYATLYTMSGGSRTQRSQVAVSTAAATYEIRYASGTKVYSVWRNGSQITSWTDSGNITPTGLGNRYGGVALEGTRAGWFGLSFDKANPIDDWLLADV